MKRRDSVPKNGKTADVAEVDKKKFIEISRHLEVGSYLGTFLVLFPYGDFEESFMFHVLINFDRFQEAVQVSRGCRLLNNLLV